MKVRITLNDDELASCYAAAREITLGEAIGELVRSRNVAEDQQFPNIKIGPNGIPIFSSRGGPTTAKMVKALQDGD